MNETLKSQIFGSKKQSKKDNFFDTAYYDDDIFDELDDDLYDDEYEDDYDNEYEDDCDDPRNNRQKEKKSRKNRGVKVPNVAKPVAKTAKAGGKILFKFINLLLRMGTLLLIAWIIYLLGLHFLANAGSFGNIVSRLTSADQELIAYLAVGAVLIMGVDLHPLLSLLPDHICPQCLPYSSHRLLPHFWVFIML